MTVICWDGQALAADRMANYSGAKLTATKVHRLDADRLAAISGSGAHGLALLRWLRNGGNPDDYPRPRDADEHAHLLVINRNGPALNYEGIPEPNVIEDERFAMGAGRDFAMGAMAAGASAREAVEITNALCIYCGLGVDTLTFEGEP